MHGLDSVSLSSFSNASSKYWKKTLSALLLSLGVMALSQTSAFAADSSDDPAFVTLDGKNVKLSDYRGKWVIVNYWATWCPPCRMEIPELEMFYEKHKDKDAVVLGVNYETGDVKHVQDFARQQMVSYPIVREKGGANGRSTVFGPLKGLPTTYMVTPKGEVVAARTGMVDQKMLEDFMAKFNSMSSKDK
ncbi:TlpA disulfide reductase family protein [Hydrogenovibrio sp. JE_KL2]|uniref:TlpA disulfide reductase family protein n=1 Tax=Hydrogenovibrio sp. JE_KL2 TaxID=2651188 RepID=UPI0020A5B7FE|nr:TlpA disulfide reductase family protein [Hydrogenovibrio sp. JE_KL2]